MRLLLIDHESASRATVAGLGLTSAGHQAMRVTACSEALRALDDHYFDAAVLVVAADGDDALEFLASLRNGFPDVDLIVVAQEHLPRTLAESIRSGAADYVSPPAAREQVLRALARVERMRKLEARVVDLEGRLSAGWAGLMAPDFGTEDAAVQAAYDMALRAAATSAAILLSGESGTGKTVLAHAIHERSPQAAGKFVVMECWGLSPDAARAVLFGCRDRALPGFHDQGGKVEQGRGGTLYLHEVGELPIEIQPDLLRLIERQEYQRAGETRLRRSVIRVIAATRRELPGAAARGRFRQDLLQRLQTFSVHLPSLRERLTDLDRFITHYLQFYSRHFRKHIGGIAPAARDALCHYTWPGNLRELTNIIERGVLLAAGGHLELRDLPADLGSADAAPSSDDVQLGAPLPLAEIEKEHIRRVMDNSPTFEEAATVLAIDPATLYRKRKLWGL